MHKKLTKNECLYLYILELFAAYIPFTAIMWKAVEKFQIRRTDWLESFKVSSIRIGLATQKC